MKRVFVICAGVVLVSLPLTTSAWGQSLPASQPVLASPPASQPAPSTQPINRTDLAVTVDGHQILETEIDAVIHDRYPNLEKGDDPRKRATMLIARDQLREELINDWLLDRQIEKSNLTLSDEEVARFTDEETRGRMSLDGLTRDELDTSFRRQQNTTLDEFTAKRLADVLRRKWLLRNKLLRATFPDRVAVSDDEVREGYQTRIDLRFKRPEQVRASHILIATAERMTDEQRSELRKKAAEVLAEVRKPGADFGELARKYSDCLTKEKGGDLGFFSQKSPSESGVADAAFKLKVGDISDVLDTKRGFEIIKVTDRRGPSVVPFEQARDGMRMLLEDQKLRQVRTEFCDELRKAVKIEYPPDKQPHNLTSPTGQATPGTTPPQKIGG